MLIAAGTQPPFITAEPLRVLYKLGKYGPPRVRIKVWDERLNESAVNGWENEERHEWVPNLNVMEWMRSGR